MIVQVVITASITFIVTNHHRRADFLLTVVNTTGHRSLSMCELFRVVVFPIVRYYLQVFAFSR